MGWYASILITNSSYFSLQWWFIQRWRSLFPPKQYNTSSSITIFSKKNDAISKKKRPKPKLQNQTTAFFKAIHPFRISEELVRARVTYLIPPHHPRQRNETKFQVCLQIVFEPQGNGKKYKLSWNAESSLFYHLWLLQKWIQTKLGLSIKASTELSYPIKFWARSKTIADEVHVFSSTPS